MWYLTFHYSKTISCAMRPFLKNIKCVVYLGNIASTPWWKTVKVMTWNSLLLGWCVVVSQHTQALWERNLGNGRGGIDFSFKVFSDFPISLRVRNWNRSWNPGLLHFPHQSSSSHTVWCFSFSFFFFPVFNVSNRRPTFSIFCWYNCQSLLNVLVFFSFSYWKPVNQTN